MAIKTNKTSIYSIISLEIVDYVKKTDVEQLEIKDQLDCLINQAVVDISQKDRMIVDTDNGATIICSGSLENALEDALFISLTIRDEILKSNANSSEPLAVFFGINTASVGQNKLKPKLVEEGVVEAQRIMHFANPNQILVSHAYYESAAKLTQEISEMFEPFDQHTDKKTLYAVRLLNEGVKVKEPAAIVVESSELGRSSLVDSVFDWTYIIPVLLSLALFFVLYELVLMPSDPPTNTVVETTVEEVPADSDEDESKLIEGPEVAANPAQDTMIKSKIKPKKTEKKVVKAKPKTSILKEKETVAVEEEKPAASTTETVVKKEKSTWESFKKNVTQGAKRECTQAEISLNQCAK